MADTPPDLQSAVFALAQEASEHPDAEVLSDVVHGFGRGGDGETTYPPRAVYNQYAGGYGQQAFGFLLVEAMSRNEKVPIFARLPPLEADERRALTSAHLAFSAFAERCLDPLATFEPHAATAVLPHARYDVPIEDHPASSLFDGTAAQDAVSAFAHHPAMQLATETAAVLPSFPDVQSHVQTMKALETEVHQLDPSDLDEYLSPPPVSAASSVRAALLPFVCSLVCLRASLHLVNEIVYRQIVQGGPILVTGADLLAVGPRVETPFGAISELDYLAGRNGARMPWHAERALILHREGAPPSEGTVHEIVGSSFNLMDAEIHVRLRDTDRWLNPAPGLLASAREAWERHR
ncbi:MAG: hypothetical protein AAFN13_10395 [Bacteroidota bacterium]